MAKAISKAKAAKTGKAVGKTTARASAGITPTSMPRARSRPKAPATKRASGSAGNVAPATGQSTEPARQTKTALLREMLAAKGGVSVADLQAATGWQPHTVRAALSGLRKAGLDIARTQDDDGASRYRITAPVQASASS